MGNLTGAQRQENTLGAKYHLGVGSSVSGADQEEGIGCVVPVTLSPGTFLFCYLALCLSLQHLTPPSFRFCSFYFLAGYLSPSSPFPLSPALCSRQTQLLKACPTCHLQPS